jgi:hypothetical protein
LFYNFHCIYDIQKLEENQQKKKKKKVKHAYLSANELEVNLDRTWEIGCAMGIPDTARSA